MPITRHFPPVYPHKDHEQPALWRKVGSYVSVADWSLINSLSGQSGLGSHIIDQAIHLTAQHIRTHGLKFPDDTATFLRWLERRGFTNDGLDVGQRERPADKLASSPQGQAGDDGRRATGSGDAAAGAAHVPSVPRTSDASVGGTEGAGGRGGVVGVGRRGRKPGTKEEKAQREG